MKTIDKSQTKNETGAIGIGAMIVFIALILVAAVASAVIIQTAEKLQQTAQQTGDDTASEQGTKIVLLSAIITDTATEEVTLTFELGAGSSTIANTAASWNVVCADGAGTAIATDDDTFANAVNVGAGAAAATLVPGTPYELPILMANCVLATTTDYNLVIAVNGGGTTFEVLSTGLSIADGQLVI